MIKGFDEFPSTSARGAARLGREDLLRVLRDQLADRVDSAKDDGEISARDFVALVKQLTDVTRELFELGADQAETELDRARAKRNRRIRGTA